MAWTPDRVETLKALWNEGLSASQIAARMGGVTRSAVIGKIHRLEESAKLRRRPWQLRKGVTRKAEPAAPARAEPAPPRPLSVPAPVAEKSALPAPVRTGPIESAFVEYGCQWPVDDADTSLGHRPCGAPLSKGSYCASHAARATESPAARKARLQMEENWADPATRARRTRSLREARERRAG